MNSLLRSLAIVAMVVSITGPPTPAQAEDKITPVLMSVPDAPIPFMGSDGREHLVYELWLTNASSGDIAVEQVQVLGDGALL